MEDYRGKDNIRLELASKAHVGLLSSNLENTFDKILGFDGERRSEGKENGL